MLRAPLPPNDKERLAALHRYCVLETASEPAFDRLTQILQHILRVPTVLVSLIDANRQWFKSRIGLDATETPRGISFCGHTIVQRRMLIVPDATRDPRFADNPLVTAAPNIRFYAGAPLITHDGFALGTLCVLDYTPRPVPSAAEQETHQKLADAVVDALEHRRRAQTAQVLGKITVAAHQASNLKAALKPVLDELCTFTGSAVGHIWMRAIDGAFVSSGLWHIADEARFASFRYKIQAAGAPSRRDLACRTLVAGRPVFVSALSDTDGPHSMLARAAMLRSGFAFAILVGSDIQMVVECYSTRQGTPEPDTMLATDHVSAQLARLAERERMEAIKSEFVSTVNHELRTPLTSIAGALQLIEAGVVGEVSEGAKRMIVIAHDNSQRLVRLVNDILDVEKMESERMPFDMSPQSLLPLVEHAVVGTVCFADSHGVRLDVDDRAPDAMASVDPDRFIQLLTNLLSNAVKFSPEGQAVTTALVRTSDGIRVSVSDRGPGIPENFRARLFEKFAQADNTDGRRRHGTGLGLVIVKNIVERMNGKISFETSAQTGTVFHVDLPDARGTSTARVA